MHLLAALFILLSACGVDAEHDEVGNPDAHPVGGDANGADASLDAATAAACRSVPDVSYRTLTTSGPVTDRPADTHADLNISLRGWTAVGANLGLVDIPGPTDANAPQLASMFRETRVPVIVGNHRVNNWDWAMNTAAGPIEEWEVTMTTMQVTPGEILALPRAGYDIGDGMQARVLYADANSVTVKYTREDNIVSGYGIHLINVCVEPSLLALYEQWNTAGRGELPALAAGQPLGRAAAAELHLAIRDTGAFLDPRSRKDWWSGN